MTLQLPDWMQHIEDSLTDMQKMTRSFIISQPFCSIMLDMGTGKTITTLSALSLIQPSGHILVVAPKTIAATTWDKEVEKWNIPLNIVSLTINEKGKTMAKQQRHDLYHQLATGTLPPSFCLLSNSTIVDLVEYLESNDLPWPFPTVILDEAQSFKSYNSVRFKAMQKVRPHITRMVQLSGTPVPNGYQDIWAQMYLLDQGQALGKNITAFRQRYCEQKPIAKDKHIYVVAGEEAENAILDSIRHLALSAKNYELVMPEKHIVDVEIELDDESKDFLDELAKEQVIEAISATLSGKLITDVDADTDFDTNSNTSTDNQLAAGTDNLVKDQVRDSIPEDLTLYFNLLSSHESVKSLNINPANAAILRAKLLQIASGAVYADDTDDNNDALASGAIMVHDLAQEPNVNLAMRTVFTGDYSRNRTTINIHNKKIETTAELIRKANSPVVLAYNYRSDLEKIMYLLPRYGITPTIFDKTSTMIDAWNNHEIDVLVIHPASAGHGLNLQHGGHTMIWFSLTDTQEHYLQANARLFRPGQTHDVTIYRLVVKDSFDHKVVKNLYNKTTKSDKFLNSLEQRPASQQPVAQLPHPSNYPQTPPAYYNPTLYPQAPYEYSNSY